MLAIKWYDRTRLVRAMASYQKAHECMQRLLLRRQYDHELDILAMALYNNLGHCVAILDKNHVAHGSHAMAYFDYLVIVMAASARNYDLEPIERIFFQGRMALGVALKMQQHAVAAA
jgi:hypothetical protein